MVSFQHNHILAIHNTVKEIDNLNIFYTTINIITTENIEFVILQTIFQILLKNGIATMNISNMMNLLIIRKIHRFIPDTIQFIRTQLHNTSRNLLCCETSIHFFNRFFWHLLIIRTSQISTLTLFHRNISKINTINTIAIGLCHRLIAIHFNGFRIRCVNDNKLATLHSGLQNLKQK